jgi:hypothetical protein
MPANREKMKATLVQFFLLFIEKGAIGRLEIFSALFGIALLRAGNSRRVRTQHKRRNRLPFPVLGTISRH